MHFPKPPPNPVCRCGHKAFIHAYLALIGGNVGRCLKRGCRCTMLEER